MKTTPFLAILTASAILSGCGGGGGGSSSGGGGTNPVSTPLVTLTPNRFTYDLAGTLSTPNSGGTQTITSSSQRVTVVSAGTTANSFTISTQDALVIPNQSASTALSLTADVIQQTGGNLILRSIDPVGGKKTLSSLNRVYVPGTFVTNTNSGTQTLAFNDGTSATYSFNIGQRVEVTVPKGTYNAYVVNSSLTFAANNKRVGTYYYVPELGTYVKSVETITRPDGTTAVVTASLISVG